MSAGRRSAEGSRSDTVSALAGAATRRGAVLPNDQEVKVALIDDLDQIADAGLDRAGQPLAFDRLAWFARTWQHCPPGSRPLVAVARAGHHAAWLFLARQGGSQVGGLVSLTSWYTLSYRPVFVGDPPPAEQARLLAAIARQLQGTTAQITLQPMPGDAAAQLAAAFAAPSWHCVRTPVTARWTAAVGGQSFAHYWAGRPGALRSTVKRKQARTMLAIAIHDRFDPVAWQHYADVYADSWKPAEGALAFLRDLAVTEGAAGTLRLGLASNDNIVIAAQLWTVEAGTAIIHKLAHRTGADRLSPGTILSQAMFAHVIDVDGVHTIDFGTGDDAYKADWMTTRTSLERVECYNLRHPRGAIGAARAMIGRLVANRPSR